MKLRFLIAAPAYSHQSAGIMALHDLCDTLNRQGFEAAMVLFHGSDAKAQSWQWAYTDRADFYHPDHQRVRLNINDADNSVRDFLENGVIIYPDLIVGNPLGASRVVRYLLYKNHSYVAASANEYILSFSTMFHSSPDSYLFKHFSDENFHSRGAAHWSKRTLDLTYIGKGATFANCFKIPETVVLTRQWPDDKNQLGILLRQCRYFFTWDSVTATNFDAVSCGAVPVLLQYNQTTKDELSGYEFGCFSSADLADFNNKESVIGSESEIDAHLNEIKSKISWYESSWPDRVREFAENAGRFFSK